MKKFKTIVTFLKSDRVLVLNSHHSLDDRFVASVEHDNYPKKVKSIDVIEYLDDNTVGLVEYYDANINNYNNFKEVSV
jgi:hypothetical protein